MRKYNPTAKHKPGGWGTPMDLDDQTAETILNEGIVGPNGKQVYSYYNGQIYEFQPDNVDDYHGYPVPGDEAPPSILREWLEKGIISNADYNKLRKGQKP